LLGLQFGPNTRQLSLAFGSSRSQVFFTPSFQLLGLGIALRLGLRRLCFTPGARLQGFGLGLQLRQRRLNGL
jgi:hypothetical protein